MTKEVVEKPAKALTVAEINARHQKLQSHLFRIEEAGKSLVEKLTKEVRELVDQGVDLTGYTYELHAGAAVEAEDADAKPAKKKAKAKSA